MTAICTLFEGHYHYGVASLTNSLYRYGFRGSIYAGYKGSLPPWSSEAKASTLLNWSGARTFDVAEGLQIHFLPIDTDYHLTNYKPDFMKQLWDNHIPEASSMFYFDPDIVLSVPWEFFEEWISSGIALCEDVNSPLPEFHPRRTAWRNYYKTKGFTLSYKDSIYVNGGFIGLSADKKKFLDIWISLQLAMSSLIGGLNVSALTGPQLPPEFQPPYSAFNKTDQDALNAAIEAWNGPYSFVGKEGMGLKPGAALLPHALGFPKPWLWKPLMQVVQGHPPRSVDRYYWEMANAVIKSQPASRVLTKKLLISASSFIGRFYRRGD